MKICFLGDASMNHVARWVNYFVDREHECLVISLEKGQSFKCAFNHVPMPALPRFIRYPLATFFISSLVRSFGPDLVNALFIPNYGLIAALMGTRPLAVTTMGSDVLVSPRRSPFHLWRTKYVLSKCDLVTSDAWMMTERIVSFGAGHEKVLTVPMGIDNSVFNMKDRTPPSLEEPVIASTRQLEPLYNVHQLVEAIPEILRAVPKAKFVIAGTGSEQEKLVEATRRNATSDAVSFAGWLRPTELAALLRRSSIFVSTSTSDSTSVSLLEAMACGAFPVVSHIPGNREWVENGVNGLLFRLGSASSLAQAVTSALSDKNLLASAVQKNSEIVQKKALWSDNMSVVESAFEVLKR
ncbi:MAG: glycosyltransferase family 4 protein [Candidatus Eiseniibacteriota bacterium]|nr:MAG: glycosyltransferase family 4 protein [Candidatus Eisenbacteria bacterium]